MPADLTLIQESLEELVGMLLDGPIAIPRLGCGAGGLEWAAVAPIMHAILDERFLLVHPFGVG